MFKLSVSHSRLTEVGREVMKHTAEVNGVKIRKLVLAPSPQEEITPAVVVVVDAPVVVTFVETWGILADLAHEIDKP